MSDEFHKKYPSPLSVYKDQALEPLGTDSVPGQKHLDNGDAANSPPSSKAYREHPAPIRPPEEGNSFDFHIYYLPSNANEKQYARELHERIRREFPEMRIYKFWEKPIGPHPVPMFEVNTFSPSQTGALFGFLVAWRGPLSVLIHPNTNDALKDHTELCAWIGKPWPIDTSFLR